MTPDTEELLDLQELAKHLRVAPRSLQKQVLEGIIPAYKVGRQWRFNLGKVLKALEKNHRESETRSHTNE